MNNLRQDLPDEGSRARVSEFFTVEVEWLPFLQCLPLDGWF
jgi:hypothetical protein